ncbi:MAG TPA: glycosyltransferase family 9 protein [Alphaproteobacteria bacterium]|nr:glycosyltransferase family 9 protein [Alphaproteobacteria bacterium]
MVEAATILVYSGLELTGDGFMKIPFLRAIRASWPSARVTWLAGQGKSVYASTLKPLVETYIDEVIEDAHIGWHVHELLTRPLAPRRFDLVIDTQRRGLTTLILRRIRHGTFIAGTGGFLFSDLKPAGKYRKPPALVPQLLDLVRVALGREPGFAPPPPLPARFDAAARALLPEGTRYVGLAPGAGGKYKCWPRDRFAALARHIQTLGVRVAFILGPQEPGWDAELGAEVPGALFPLQDSRVADEVRRSPLFTMAVGRRMALVVANDSGTSHMLAAADTPLVSLFGPSPPAKFAPLTPDLTVLRAQDFAPDSSAMEAIPLDAVAAAVERKLAAGGARV